MVVGYTLQNYVRIVIMKDVHFCSQLGYTTGKIGPTALDYVLRMSNIGHFHSLESCTVLG
jgi:hypothetical protein